MGLILGLHPANERQRYFVMKPLIGLNKQSGYFIFFISLYV